MARAVTPVEAAIAATWYTARSLNLCCFRISRFWRFSTSWEILSALITSLDSSSASLFTKAKALSHTLFFVWGLLQPAFPKHDQLFSTIPPLFLCPVLNDNLFILPRVRDCIWPDLTELALYCKCGGRRLTGQTMRSLKIPPINILKEKQSKIHQMCHSICPNSLLNTWRTTSWLRWFYCRAHIVFFHSENGTVYYWPERTKIHNVHYLCNFGCVSIGRQWC